MDTKQLSDGGVSLEHLRATGGRLLVDWEIREVVHLHLRRSDIRLQTTDISRQETGDTRPQTRTTRTKKQNFVSYAVCCTP